MSSTLSTNGDGEEKKKADKVNDLFVFTNAKAGMGDSDKERINRVIYEASKDSLYYKKTLQQDEKTNQRITLMEKKVKSISKFQLQQLEKKIDTQILPQYQLPAASHKVFIVVDMDMFFAAVEMRDNPKLRDVPLAVGGMSMISTTNYIARKFGVRAAMPGFIGKKLCPELVFVRTNSDKYAKVAQQTRQIFKDYDPDFIAGSLDEAYMDITTYLDVNEGFYCKEFDEKKLIGEERCDNFDYDMERRMFAAGNVAAEIRKKIFDSTKLTASAGIASNSMLAKICSDFNKPNGQYVLSNNNLAAFMKKLPVRKIGGVGKVMDKILRHFGIVNCNDVFDKRALVYCLFSESSATWLLNASLGYHKSGLDYDKINQNESDLSRKSISVERTFRSLEKNDQLIEMCKRLCQNISHDLNEKKISGRTITLKLKKVDFSVISRSITISSYVSKYEEIVKVGLKLLEKELPLKLRLMGIRVSSLTMNNVENSDKCNQLTLSQFCDNTAHFEASDQNPQNISRVKLRSVLPNEKDSIVQLTLSQFCSKSINESCPSDDLTANSKNDGTEILSRKRKAKTMLDYVNSCESEVVQQCPVCGEHLSFRTNMELNQHVDECLSKKEISMVLNTLNVKTKKRNRSDSKAGSINRYFPKL